MKTPHLIVLVFIYSVTSLYCLAQPCLPFKIGNGLTFNVTSDTVYLSRATDKKDSFGKPIYQIFRRQKSNSGWGEEANVSFSDGSYTNYHPVMNPAGDKIIFISRRPEPGTSNSVTYGNLWMVVKEEGDWSDPIFLEALNHQGQDSYPSFTKDGSLYFNSDRKGGKGSMDIYKSEFANEDFQKPVAQTELNTADSENDLVVDKDERFIIFNRYEFTTGQLDLHYSLRSNGQWLDSKPLTKINQENQYELTPTLSYDQSMFYYEINGEVFCMKTKELLNSYYSNNSK